MTLTRDEAKELISIMEQAREKLYVDAGEPVGSGRYRELDNAIRMLFLRLEDSRVIVQDTNGNVVCLR